MDMAPYTWDKLVTIAGTAAATMLIVQFIKGPLDKVIKIPTRWLTYIVALILMLVAHVFTARFAWADLPLILLNALLATFAAMGGYEATFSSADARTTQPVTKTKR